MKGDDRNRYQVELIHGLDYSPPRICGLRVACTLTERWVAPLNWTTGDCPAIYHSFDNASSLTLHEATLEMSDVSNFLTKILSFWAEINDVLEECTIDI